MLDLNEARRVFADHLQPNADRRHSLDAALMAACEWSYRKGLQDGAAAELERTTGEPHAPGAECYDTGDIHGTLHG